MDFLELLVADLTELEPQAPDSLKEIAYHRLEEKIVRLEFAPGSVVTEKDLAESIGIGRTPVREAIQRLAMAGLLEVLPRRGIRVSQVDADGVLRLLDVSRGVDNALARGAAVRATPEQRLEFTRVAAEFEAAAARRDPIAIVRLDSEFNNLCTSAMDNEHATKVCRLFTPVTRRFWFHHRARAGDISLGPRLHAQAARALAEGDPDKACAAFARINDFMESFVKETMYG